MKQQVIALCVIFGFVLALVGGIIYFSKQTASKEVAQSPQPSLLGLPEQAATIAGVPSRSDSQNATPQPTVIEGAIEIDLAIPSTASARLAQVTLTNGKSFTMALYQELAPKTVDNFIRKASSGFYNGLLFFRADKRQDGQSGLVQTGDPLNNGTGGGVMQAEYNKKPFTAGSVGVARGQNRDRNSNSQFFIATVDVPQLNEEYTNFGDVIEGIDVVASIKQGQPIKSITVIR